MQEESDGSFPQAKNRRRARENEKENEDEWEHHDDRIRDTEFLDRRTV